MFEQILWVVLGFAPTLAALQAADKMIANSKNSSKPLEVEA
ncbi:hypothetical protein NTE_02419 [Candidatus Nitrososphaera evergladensis SR1]|jgi:hypothetical protein|uniref:Uncharacterized protein n=1 Tax=Candidatus Nitrososphaera evergladensis SR1 TaxID=1459636 RepID=A0A075MYY4_9ARCH|nr:hypothetical protein [Candidatus Nitrososphaera evergladensis]AIF84469.1 hypothetical protein NTE_02419 [Candidatus Nitrososphaera evergladensis SR1]